MASRWRVRLSHPARADLAAIISWTVQNFGVEQAVVYRDIVRSALSELAGGPDIPNAKLRGDIAPEIRTLHIARSGRRARHLLVFKVSGTQTMEIIRILHDSMDLVRHLPETDESEDQD